MNRIKNFLSIALPSMFAGGLVFGTAFGYASAGDGSTSSGTLIAQADPWGPPAPPPPPPAAPSWGQVPSPPPAPPSPPPAPPRPPKFKDKGISFSIDNGVVRLDGIDALVSNQLETARRQIKNHPGLSPALRDKILARIDMAGAKIKSRLARLKISDLESLGEELEELGEELEDLMEDFEDELGEQLEDELEKLGERLGKDLAKQLGGLRIDFDDDDDDDDHRRRRHHRFDRPQPGQSYDVDFEVDVIADENELRDAMSKLQGLSLQPAQRAAIARIRAESERSISPAKRRLEQLSAQLERALANTAISDAEIASYVDQISAQEAAIRKARLLAWVQARRVLDDSQRHQIERAARGRTR